MRCIVCGRVIWWEIVVRVVKMREDEVKGVVISDWRVVCRDVCCCRLCYVW